MSRRAFEVFVDGPLPGLNDLLDWRRRSLRRRGADLYWLRKREWSERIAASVLDAGWSRRRRPFSGAVKITCEWVERSRRRDPDNIVGGGKKLLLDALVHCGIIRNDGWNIIAFADTWRKARPGEGAGVKVRIEEVPDAGAGSAGEEDEAGRTRPRRNRRGGSSSR